MTAVNNRNYLKGAAGEELVAQKYANAGFEIVARNFRRPTYGEIDIIAVAKTKYYFVECKTSGTLDQAALLLCSQQRVRMHLTAQKFLSENDLPQDTEMRFDAALVDKFGNVDVRVGALN